MERESFEDEAVSKILNENFVAIKVDREERPDIDHIYMLVTQMFIGQGGWPLTILLTPEREPFFAGTYFPKEDRMGMQGLVHILLNTIDAWKSNKQYVERIGRRMVKALKYQEMQSKDVNDIKENIIYETFEQLVSSFDTLYGGFGRAPKFPTPHTLFFLLRYWYKTKEPSALKMVEKTLTAMHKGGIYDHIGYGFCRYSTDRKWLVPHFEKMLYDNALLAIAYVETYHVTKNKNYAQVAEQIYAYIIRDMTSKSLDTSNIREVGFFSAEDADSEGEEGKFYVWDVEDVKSVLGERDGARFCKCFDITPDGNFEGKNIPNLIKDAASIGDKEFIEYCREKMFKHREKRVHPHKDDKILTAWNGLMIVSLAIGGRVLNNKVYIDFAESAVRFIYKNLIRSDRRLMARYRDGEAAFLAYVDDYSFLIWGLIELYESTFNSDYLSKAIELSNEMIKYFWDEKKGGFFIYGKDAEELIIRPKEVYDGAIPSGNSVAVLNLIRLSRMTGQLIFEDKANEMLKVFGDRMEEYPKGCTFLLMGLMYLQSHSNEIILVGDRSTEDMAGMIDIIRRDFSPFTVCTIFSQQDQTIQDIVYDVSSYSSIEGKTTAYVCRGKSCLSPITDVNKLRDLLKN